MNLAHWINRASNAWPQNPAIGLGTEIIADYATLSDRVARLAGGMKNLTGLDRGDRVAIIMKNRPEYIEIMFAIWHAGLVAVPVNAKLHQREYSFILADCNARAVFHSPGINLDAPDHAICTPSIEYDQLLQSEPVIMVETEPDDLAWLFYTSGTTGTPKGAMLSHRNLLAMSLNYFADFDRIMPGHSIIHPAPLSHGAGLWMLPHICAGAVNVIPKSGGFDEAEIFELIDAWPHVSMFAAPTMVRRLTLHGDDRPLDNLKLIIYGGAPMYVADCQAALARFGPRLAQLYGQGESPMTITHLSREMIGNHHKLDSVGIPDACIEVKIVNQAGEPLGAGEKGEIICKGDTVMLGYWNNQPATAKALKNGWLHTGDIGHVDKDGFVFLTDRSKDLIISGGSNIYPREIEEVLLTMPGIAEIAVIGRPDPDWGEIAIAYVVLEDGASLDEAAMDAHCLNSLARFKRPKHYVIIDALPKSGYGKILKSRLREIDRNA